MTAVGAEQMNMVEIARKLAEMGETERALKAYTVALKQDSIAGEDRLEAACAVFQYGEDYKIAYNSFLSLYRDKQFREDVYHILTDAFYLPNAAQQKKRYQKNCKLLKNYPYLFRQDFLPFEELPVQFYPYDDNGVLPFYRAEERFGEYIDFNEPLIRHYFFRDLTKPVLAEDIYSQYELEYLRDNVRRSDWVGYENHIYLHYSDWGTFCAYLQCLDVKPLLEEKKFVFLIGDEAAQYPIDFKERFGIDYSQYPVKPIGIREVNKIVLHTQFHAHNGGDFFNEILHEHPNLFAGDSIVLENLMPLLESIKDNAKVIRESNGRLNWSEETVNRFGTRLLQELNSLKDVTLKDALVTVHLGNKIFMEHINASERIVPAIMFQPHFYHMGFKWQLHESGAIAVSSSAFDELKKTGILEKFKYIKTFTPIRRPTTSHGATVRFMVNQVKSGGNHRNKGKDSLAIITDVFLDRIQNRTFMVAKGDRMFADSRMVRFEDAKLNPVATFTALAEFLDIPYTESMTYCSDFMGRDPAGIGFNTAAVYRTYDEYCDIYERKLMEYQMRDIYEKYGYSYEQYDGKPMTAEEEEALLEKCKCNQDAMERSWREDREKLGRRFQVDGKLLDIRLEASIAKALDESKECRLLTLRVARHGLSFCNEQGERLELMEPLKLDPALLETELYH